MVAFEYFTGLSMSKYAWLISFIALLALAISACVNGDDSANDNGGSAGSGGNPNTGDPGFVGKWACSTTTTTSYASPPVGESSATTTSTTTIAINGGQIVESFIGDVGFDCPIFFTISGKTATAVAGQTCSGGGITLTFTSGTLTLTDAQHMTRTYSYSISGSADGGAVSGAASAGSGCTKS